MAALKIDHSYTSAAAGRANTVRFCSRCGEPAAEPTGGERPLTRTRVCQTCGMGMLLSCLPEALPGAGAAFIIVTADLRISAVSEAGEVLFGAEQRLLGTPFGEVVVSPLGNAGLERAVARAALRNREPVVLPVRGVGPRARAAGMLAARVSTCGTPRAALVMVEPSGFGRR